MSILKASQVSHPAGSKREDGATEPIPQSARVDREALNALPTPAPERLNDASLSASQPHRASSLTASISHSAVSSTSGSSDLVWIALNNLEFKVIIGIHPHERVTAQPLSIDLEMGLEKQMWVQSATTGALDKSVDYSQIARSIQELAEGGRFRLIESLAYVLASTLLHTPSPCEARVQIHVLRLIIRKPNALSKSGGAIPMVISEIRARDLNTSPCLPDIDLHQLSERYGVKETVHLTPIVSLEEVSVVRVSALESGSIMLQPHECIVRLGGVMTVTDGVALWSQELSALHLIRHERSHAASSLTTDLTSKLVNPLESPEA